MRVLYCNCTHARAVPPEVKRAVLRKLSAAGVAFDAVADLCGVSARKDPAFVRIAACFPRAVTWLFDAADAPLSEQRVKVLNMRRQSADEVVSGLLSEETPPGERPA